MASENHGTRQRGPASISLHAQERAVWGKGVRGAGGDRIQAGARGGGGTGSRSEFGPPRARVGAFGGHSVVRVLDFGGIGIR